ncbi:hypothetical protein ACHHYP_07457 [Achlya hypogyna]|uniref:Multidrug/Oligosaccharidyl-lipid/Polysaccharide (MOP) Flippase Superfamily n=1 Tax=Achlya hypogyna TaxID=1202772 RepID=A0A1V9ZM47_ACHHY|nr:hypothetical protein ACHHYP_07457 [Achlya hypogyna]
MASTEASKLVRPTSPAKFQYEDGIQPHVVLPLRAEFGALAGLATCLSIAELPRHLLTMTNAAFLGHLGTRELAGAALALAWTGLPAAFMREAITAMGKLCRQAKGAGYDLVAGSWLQTAIVFAVVASVPVMLWHYFVGDMIGLSVTDKPTVMYGRDYAQVVALAVVPQSIYRALSTFFDAQNISAPTTVVNVAAIGANVVFNYIFVTGGFGCPAYGVVGAGIAAVATSVFQLLLYVAITVVWLHLHRRSWAGWSWDCVDSDHFFTFVAAAVPAGTGAAMDWVPLTLIGAMAGHLGYSVTAAQAILQGLFGLLSTTIDGAAGATQTRMTRYLEQGCARSARRVLALSTCLVAVGALLLLTLVLPFHTAILRLWTTDANVLDLCAEVLAVFVAGALATLARALLTGAMVALAMADFAFVANMLGRACVLAPLVVFFPVSLGWGVEGFWWAHTSAELVQVTLLGVGLHRLNWHLAAQRVQYVTPPSSSSMRRIVLV